MTGFVGNIEKMTLQNDYFREVLFTGKYAQLVVMCLQPDEEIGNEVHANVDQFFRIEQGEAKFLFNGNKSRLSMAAMQSVSRLRPFIMSSQHPRTSR